MIQIYACCYAYSVTQLCLTLHAPMDCSPPGSSAHGILQARNLKWVGLPCPPPGDLAKPGFEPTAPAFGRQILYHCATWEALVCNYSLFLFTTI